MKVEKKKIEELKKAEGKRVKLTIKINNEEETELEGKIEELETQWSRLKIQLENGAVKISIPFEMITKIKIK